MSNYVLNNSINKFCVSFDTYLQENADHIGDRKFLALFVLKCQYLASQGWNVFFCTDSNIFLRFVSISQLHK